jgi:ADP-ribose pyrophosphatase YjhB (NUDIX family)
MESATRPLDNVRIAAVKSRKRSISLVIAGPEGDRLLLVRRPPDDESLPGVWGLPAASLADGESEEDAVRRAGRTKLGVDVRPLRVLGEAGVERAGYNHHMCTFEVEVLAGEPAVPQPGGGTQYDAWRWGDTAELEPAARAGSLCSQALLRARGMAW